MKRIYLLIVCLYFLAQHTSSQVLPGGSPLNGITVAGGNGPGSAANQLAFPRGIFVDANGNIYVSDSYNNRIQKWAPGASIGITVAGGNGYGSAANQLAAPFGIFGDANSNIYIAEYANNRIQKWAPGASEGITVAGGNGPGGAPNQLYEPIGVFVDATGNIYVADHRNSRIQKWAPRASAGITVAGGNGEGSSAQQFNQPFSVFVDLTENIYVADAGNNRIQKWAPGASAGITVAGGNGEGSAAHQLNFPTDVFVDASGNIYVADNDNNRIQKWVSGGSIGNTVAGGNGSGSAANQLAAPSRVFVDEAGSIYVVDEFNHRIQKFGVLDVELISCPANLNVVAPSCSDKVTITWTEPRDTFPSTIKAPVELDPSEGTFTYMGALDGHGYYKSTNTYLWPVARDIAKLIGGAGVNGHLATLTSARENDFIYNQIKGSGYAPWIGLFNTGRPGRFRWVQGESLAYANWAPGEPNNAGGNARNVTEPYVRLSDIDGAWNDQRNDYLPFILEFEKPLIRYKQISGPKNGSDQMAGVYQVCYQRKNLITDKKDTCCFSVTVTCNTTLITNANGYVIDNELAGNNINKVLHITTSPNPSSNSFRLSVVSNSNERISLQVSDVLGRVVESRQGVTPNQALQIGTNYRPGIYIAQVIQGTKKVTIRLIKTI